MKGRTYFLASLSLFFAFALSTGLTYYCQQTPLDRTTTVVIAAGGQAICCLAPLLLMRLAMPPKAQLTRADLKPPSRRGMGLSIYLGIAVGFTAFLARYAIERMLGNEMFAVQVSPFLAFDQEIDALWIFLGGAILPALIEEVWLRGYFQKFLSQAFPSRAVIGFSAIFYAMLAGTPEELLGYFIAGVAFSWLVTVTNTVFSAILAHMFCFATLCVIGMLLESFSAYGLWTAFPQIAGIMALLFWYMALRQAHIMLLFKQIKPLVFQRQNNRAFMHLLTNVGSIAFLFAYIAQAMTYFM